MTDKVVSINGGQIANESKPNETLIDVLRRTLDMAEQGKLQSFVGVGFTTDGLRLRLYDDSHADAHQMLGSIEWLKAEYMAKNMERIIT